jgi:hypothetical protein
MQENSGRIPPARQRRFDRAFLEIERLCPGWTGRRSDWRVAHALDVNPSVIERVRWLLVALARSRATPGAEVIARLAERGYAISTRNAPFRHAAEIVPLDQPGFIYLGLMLPSSRRPWKRIEEVACDLDPEIWPMRRWCSAHESVAIRAAIEAEGHIIEP